MTIEEQPIVPGLSVSKTGQATVDSSLRNVLFDLAIKLEEITAHPVDVQHVVAALVLAARNGQLDSSLPLTSGDETATTLAVHVTTVFARYGSNLGADD